MAGKTSIGTVWINVKPSLDGVQNAINSQLQGIGSDFSDQMGSEIRKSSAIGTAIGTVVGNAISLAMSKVGELVSGAFETMDSVIRSQNALEQMGYDSGKVASKLQQLRNNANKTAAEVGDLSDGFMALTASWKDMDLTADATQALSDAILSFGGTPDMVANAITQISQVDIDGPLDAQTWLSLRNSGLVPVLSTLARMNGMDLGEYKEALGSGELKTRDFVTALIGLDKHGSDTQQSLEEIAKSNAAATWSGSWGAATETVSSALADQLQKLWESSDAGEKILSIADDIAKKIPEWVDAVKDFFNWLGSSDEAARTLRVTVEAISATALIIGMKELATVWLPKVVDFFISIKSAVTALLSPLNIVIAAVVGLGILLYNAIIDTFGSIGSWLSTLKVSWTEFWNNIGATLEEWCYLISITWNGFWNSVGETISNAWGSVVEFFTGIWEKIKEAFNGVAGWFKQIFTDAWEGVKSAFNAVGEFFDGIWETITEAFSGAWQLGQDIVNGLVQGIQDAATWAGQKIEEFCDNALQGIKDFFGIKSPSKVMAEIGRYIDQGLVKGIDSEAGEVARSMRSMGEGALAEMATLDSRLSSGLSTSMSFTSDFNNEAQARVIQNNNINITDGFDLKLAESQLGYAVAMA